MAMVTLTSHCNKENNNLRDASFSSYLDGAEKCFVLKLAESSQDIYLGRNKIEDEEIGIFGAEKYLNGGADQENPRIANRGAMNYPYEQNEGVDQGTTKPKHEPKIPSVRSESSWNSRNALLNTIQSNPAPRKTSKSHGRRFLATLGCICSCRNKSSVDIGESVCETNSIRSVRCGTVQHEPIPISADLARMSKSRVEPIVKEEMKYDKFDELGLGIPKEDCFSFPTLNSYHENGDVKARDSSEVLGSPIGLSSRRLSMLNWDVNSRMVEGAETAAYFDAMYNGFESDTSSDLFEIESFTANANSNSNSNSNPCFARQVSDGMSGCGTPTTCYAPSEASIEWSVVTASAADFSLVSDSEELRTASAAAKNQNKNISPGKIATSKDAQRRRPGLLGCKSHKSVSIAANAYRSNRTNEEAVADLKWRQKPDSFAPGTRFRAEDKLTGF